MITFQNFQDVINSQVPFDTGNMFQNGIDYFDTPEYYLASYNVYRVPYIIYNEMGTKYSVKNKGFISDKTVGLLNYITQQNSVGVQAIFGDIDNTIKERNSILQSMGTMKRGL